MLNTIVAGLCAGLIALVAAPLAASAQDAIAAPGQKTIGQPQATKDAMIPSLAVINSRGATIQGNILTMTGVWIEFHRLRRSSVPRGRARPDQALSKGVG